MCQDEESLAKNAEQNADLTQTVSPKGTRLLKTAIQVQSILQTVTSARRRCVWLGNVCTLYCLLTPGSLSNNLRLRLKVSLSASPTSHPGQQSHICKILEPKKQAISYSECVINGQNAVET